MSENPNFPTVTIKGRTFTFDELAVRFDEVLDERSEMNHKIHDLKTQLQRARVRLGQLGTWLDVDLDDEQSVAKVIEDAKALKRFKSREKGDKLRSGEGFSPNTLAHYEKKLADKRSQIRRLEKQNAELRAKISGVECDESGQLGTGVTA